MKISKKKFFCLGTGYSAKVIARMLLANSEPIKWISLRVIPQKGPSQGSIEHRYNTDQL